MSTIVQERTKECSKCGEAKDYGDFYRDSRSTDGLRASCKECTYPDRKRPIAPKGTKLCGMCKVLKPLSEFHRDSRLKNGRVSKCKVCAKAHKADWHADNRSRNNEVNKLWEIENQGRAKAYRSNWSKENPDKTRAKAQRRRAAKAKADNDNHTDQQVWELYGTDCYLCGTQVVENGKRLPNYHEEHVVPISRGGDNTLENVRASCSACNFSKNATRLISWLARRQPSDLVVTETDCSEYAEECRRLDAGMLCVGYAVRIQRLATSSLRQQGSRPSAHRPCATFHVDPRSSTRQIVPLGGCSCESGSGVHVY